MGVGENRTSFGVSENLTIALDSSGLSVVVPSSTDGGEGVGVVRTRCSANRRTHGTLTSDTATVRQHETHANSDRTGYLPGYCSTKYYVVRLFALLTYPPYVAETWSWHEAKHRTNFLSMHMHCTCTQHLPASGSLSYLAGTNGMHSPDPHTEYRHRCWHIDRPHHLGVATPA